jgi:hypothetical protein
MIVAGNTPDHLRLLVADTTRNALGFEHKDSTSMTTNIRKLGVAVTLGGPVFTADYGGQLSSRR